MIRDLGRRDRPGGGGHAPSNDARRSRTARKIGVETLEGRQLLANFFSGPSINRPVMTAGGTYLLTMTGPGFVNARPTGRGAVALVLYGTTPESQLDMSLINQRLHRPATPLQLSAIRVTSGQVGAVNLPSANLLGPMTPITSSVQSLVFGGLGSNARVEVNGSVAGLGVVGGVNLGPDGIVSITGDLGQSLTVGGPMVLDGGAFVVGNDLAGAINVGSIAIGRGGLFSVGDDLTGGGQVAGDLGVAGNGTFSVGNNLGGLTVGRTLRVETGGSLTVGNDINGGVTLGGLSLTDDGRFTVGRDVTGRLDVTGDALLANGGLLDVGRDLAEMAVHGDLRVQPGGRIDVGGNLGLLQVDGTFYGQNSPTAVDLFVGLDLVDFRVLGGAPNQGSVQGANIEVVKSILALDLRHGIFNSYLTAGVLIDGGANTPPGGNIGPDGPDAILNSEINAGVRIQNLIVNGNVRSTFVTNPDSAGYPTRIISGLDRTGHYSSASVIDNFQILGTMFDSVVAASVAPYGGDGTLPTGGYGPERVVGPPPGDGGNSVYDAPAGFVIGGTVGSPARYATYTEVGYRNMRPFNDPSYVFYNPLYSPAYWNTVTDPTIDDAILAGSINPSFASAPLSDEDLLDPTTAYPLPTQSTVLGGVVTTVRAGEGDQYDNAGLLAADTRGVFVGALPDG